MFALRSLVPPLTRPLCTPLLVRGLRKGSAPRKPHLRIKVASDGSVKVPASVRGWSHEERDKYVRWLEGTQTRLAKELGQSVGDRYATELQREVNNYIATWWGLLQAEIKARVLRKRVVARKARRVRLLAGKMALWQGGEDAKEHRIVRDRARAERERAHTPFSFAAFLREQRRARRGVAPLESEATFEQRLALDRKTYLAHPPKAVRRVLHKRVEAELGYEKRLEREVLAPWLHEVRRRARAAELVRVRLEEEQRVGWEVAQAQERLVREEARTERWRARQAHWNKVLGQWHAAHSAERGLKAQYMAERREVQAEARGEFLQALADDVDKWVQTPSECRFLRFRFASGITFPLTKAAYH